MVILAAQPIQPSPDAGCALEGKLVGEPVAELAPPEPFVTTKPGFVGVLELEVITVELGMAAALDPVVCIGELGIAVPIATGTVFVAAEGGIVGTEAVVGKLDVPDEPDPEAEPVPELAE